MNPNYTQVQIIREWVGQDIDESMIYDTAAEYDTVDETIDALLRIQLADARNAPQSFSAAGISLNMPDSVGAIERTMARFRSRGGTDGTVQAKRFYRPDYR